MHFFFRQGFAFLAGVTLIEKTFRRRQPCDVDVAADDDGISNGKDDDSDGDQKKAKEKKGGAISASVKSPTKKAKRKGESSVEEFSPSRNTRQSKGAVSNKKTKK